MKKPALVISFLVWLGSGGSAAAQMNNTFATAFWAEPAANLAQSAESTQLPSALPSSLTTKRVESVSTATDPPSPLAVGEPTRLAATQEMTIELAAAAPAYLSFWFNFETYEEGAGFDEPGFTVSLDDQLIYQYWASDLVDQGLTDGSFHTADSSGWRQMVLPLPATAGGVYPVTFAASNTGDNLYPSQVQIAEVRAIDRVEDEAPPSPVTDLQAFLELDDSVTLTWTAPSDSGSAIATQVCQYQVRSSHQPIPINITEADWLNLPRLEVDQQFQNHPQSLLAPRSPGRTELFHLKSSNDDPTAQINFIAVASFDCAGLFSGLATGSQVQVNLPLVTTWLDDHQVQVILLQPDQTQPTAFRLEYQHRVDDQLVTEVVLGELRCDQTVCQSPLIILGTCSQADCDYHDLESGIKVTPR